jgi:protoheme IX farnesyltransferase
VDLTEERSFADTLRLYLDITRPRVMALVVFTGLPALMLGRSEWPDLGTALVVLAGTAAIGGASSAFNAYIEREADARMSRTRRRPLPAAVVVPQAVLAYGALLTVVGTAMLWATGGFVAAAIGIATVLFYVFGYTMWLKPRTPQNIVIGGAAGSTAPLIASAAVDGTVSLGAWILFLIVFLWTPPHVWGIAIFRRKEYEAAGYPMMPSVVGEEGTRWRSLGYTLALVVVTLAPVWLGYLSWVYGVVALALGAWFTRSVVRSMQVRRPIVDYRVFKDSIVYLTLLFVVMLGELVFWGQA